MSPLLLAAAAAAALATSAAYGQAYPTKPVRLVTTAAGSGSDFLARLLVPGLSTRLGQRVVVDNRGLIAAELVAQAPADGYTILLNGSTLWLLPLMRAKVPYDPVKDFAEVILVTRAPNVLVVHPSLPVRNVRDLIALARAKPGQLNYGTTGVGNSVHIAAELFKSMAKLDMVRVNYKGSPAAYSDLITGQVHLIFGVPGAVEQHVKTGRLRALAVSSAQPSPLLPGLPTVSATLPGYESVSYLGIFAPANTPAPIVQRLNQELARVIAEPEVKDRLHIAGLETVGGTSDEFRNLVRAEMKKYGTFFKQANIKDE